MGPRFKKHSVLYFPEGREHPHLLATYVKLEPVCNVSSFPPYFKYSLYSSTCSMMTPRWRENICIEIKHEISYLDVSGALFHTIAQRSLLAMTPEEELLQNEDQKTPPWRPEIRSQFLLTRTPPKSTLEPGPEQVSLLEGFAGQLYEKRAPETSKYEISCFISIHMFSLHLGVIIEQVEE